VTLEANGAPASESASAHAAAPTRIDETTSHGAPAQREPPGGATPETTYRSRKAALDRRIANVEAELRELRAERSGLPSVRGHRFWVTLGAVLGIVVAGALTVCLMRRPDKFTFTSSMHNAGWTLTFQFEKPIQCIDVIVEGRNGKRDRVDCMTFSSAPQVANAALTMDQARTSSTLIVEYEVGHARRQVTTPFNPRSSQIDQVKHILTMVGQWVEGRDFNGRRLLYFTSVLTNANVLEEIRYGFDDAPLDQTVRFRPRDELGILNDDELYRDIPFAVRFVNVQLTFADGTTMTRKVPVMPNGAGQ
jgi:hypothetical protein